MERPIPATIGKYEIIGILGRGGMGVVYHAHDPRMGRQVAIKTVTEGVLGAPGIMTQRFYGEAEKMGMLKHPNIITVYDLGEQDGFPYIVMEFVEGVPLDKLVATAATIPLIYKLRVIEQVCGALGYAHTHDVVHRDVKPANVIVRPDGVAKLLDFGIARQEKNPSDRGLTTQGGVIGTVPYMAPERLRGAALDGRSDIFATGVMMYQLLTGVLPFPGHELVLVNQLLTEKCPSLSAQIDNYPPALDHIIAKAVEKDPNDRYQTAEDMAAELYDVIEVLKHDYADHLILQAEQMRAESNFLGARDTLVQLLKLDNQHPQGRKLLAEINAQLTRAARVQQATEKRAQAQGALDERRYDDAVRLLEDAVRLTPEDTLTRQHLEAARKGRETNERILDFLRRADEAKRGGDFATAKGIVEQAIALDTRNSRLRAAYTALVRQAEEAAAQTRLRGLLEQARQALALRQFAHVLTLVKEAEEIDPSRVELQDLGLAGNEGLAQEARRRLLEELEVLLLDAITEADFKRIEALVLSAMEKSPGDAMLLRYQAQVARRLQETETRRKVDETIVASRSLMESSPAEALAGVQTLLARFPDDERLLAFENSLIERLSRSQAQEARNRILADARKALALNEFAQAVMILARCQGELRTTEIEELQSYAREEAEREANRQQIGRICTEAQALAEAGRHEEVFALVASVAPTSGDARLRKLLAAAQTAIEHRGTEEAVLGQKVRELAGGGFYDQAVAVAESMPTPAVAEAGLREVIQAAQKAWSRECAGLLRMGQAYATLAGAGASAIPPVEPDDPPILGAMAQKLAGRKTPAGA